MTLEYKKGDAAAVTTYPCVIPHICNDRGGWGRGFVLALSKRWTGPEAVYRKWHRDGVYDGVPFQLGNVIFVEVVPTVWVANMVAQVGYGANNANRHGSSEPNATPPIRYDALESCMVRVGEFTREREASIQAPKFGSGLAGGKWPLIEELILKHWSDLSVTILEL